ncbi:MAG TPA: hypothetical protein VMS64_19870 [Candidatus Methylomirabilis sp.]|nr:hypothetical protein [Candidatus Methylomirabilis sp.]
MTSRCRCGSPIEHSYDHLGCIQCGAACCPACSYELESANYCANCAEALLDLPWAGVVNPGRHAVGVI